jgi:endonuclease/exonuclease/phosphatase (EEP) superfamily protein YafD
MISKKDKAELLKIIKKIDVKQMSIDHENTNIQKWFRFGNYNMAQIISEIIKQYPDEQIKIEGVS